MLKRNLFFLLSITLFASASLVLDIFNYNPFRATSGEFINLYISLFISLAGIFSIAIYLIKYKLFRNKMIYLYFWSTIRQSLLISASITIIVFLKGLKILDLWIAIPTVLSIVLLEFFFQTIFKDKTNRKLT